MTRVYLFPTLSQTSGGFGGRSGADNLCQTARNASTFPENQCANVRAFVSLSAADEIVDLSANYSMPANLPFYSSNDTFLGSNFADMVDGSIAVTLAAAGYSMAVGWYSFSTLGTGVVDGAANCLGGMDGSAGSQGRYGADNNAAVSWMSLTQNTCNTARYLLCVCF